MKSTRNIYKAQRINEIKIMDYLFFILCVLTLSLVFHGIFTILGQKIIYVYSSTIVVKVAAYTLELISSFAIAYYAIKKRLTKQLKGTLIIMYVIFLLLLLFSRTQSPERSINLGLYEITPDNDIERISFIINIFAFIPIGYILKRTPIPLLIIFTILIELGIETTQYFTRLGVFDVGDILLNSIGILIGFILGKFILIIYNKREAKKEKEVSLGDLYSDFELEYLPEEKRKEILKNIKR